jgi:hypothetical protein
MFQSCESTPSNTAAYGVRQDRGICGVTMVLDERIHELERIILNTN